MHYQDKLFIFYNYINIKVIIKNFQLENFHQGKFSFMKYGYFILNN